MNKDQATIYGIDNVFGIPFSAKKPLTAMEATEKAQNCQKANPEDEKDRYGFTAEEYELQIHDGDGTPLPIDYILKDDEAYILCVIQE